MDVLKVNISRSFPLAELAKSISKSKLCERAINVAMNTCCEKWIHINVN